MKKSDGVAPTPSSEHDEHSAGMDAGYVFAQQAKQLAEKREEEEKKK